MSASISPSISRILQIIFVVLSLVGCGGGSDPDPASDATPVVLESLSIGPTINTSLPMGTVQQLLLEGAYSDGSHSAVAAVAQWSSSNDASVSVSSTGLLTAVAEGSGVISAQVNGVRAELIVTVGPAALMSIELSPLAPVIALGNTVALSAVGHYSDATQVDLSALGVWSSSDDLVVTVDAAGLVSTHSVATASVVVSYLGLSASVDVEVVAAELQSLSISHLSPDMPLGTQLQLSVLGHYSDASEVDLTSSVIWSSDEGTLVSVNTGLLHALSMGSAVVTANVGAVSVASTVTVSAAVLDVMTISAADTAVVAGNVLALSVTGVYSDRSLYASGALDSSLRDLTSVVEWVSADSSIARVSPIGSVTGVAAGSVTITASYDGKNAVFDVDVWPFTVATLAQKLVSLAVTPTQLDLVVGVAGEVRAFGTFLDGSSRNVTELVEWASSDIAVSTVANSVPDKGLVGALAVGNSVVSATVGGHLAQSSITVAPAILVGIEVGPQSLDLALGSSYEMVATGIYSDGGTYDISEQVSWSSSDPTVANFGANSAQLASLSLGVTTVTALMPGGHSAASNVTVTSAVITSLEISSTGDSVPVGGKPSYKAVAVYSDKQTVDVTSQAVWTVSDPVVAIVDSAGQVATLSQGVVNIGAEYTSQSVTSLLTVTAAELTNIEISPIGGVVPLGGEQSFTALGHYSDGSSSDLSSQVVWQSSDEAFVGVSGQGFVSAKAVTTAPVQITASLSGVLAFTTLEVTAATLQSIDLAPLNLSLATGTERAMVATGLYSDGSRRDLSSEVIWGSTSSAVFYVSNAGEDRARGYGVSVGVASVTASLGDIVSSSLSVEVTSAVLTSISVSAPSVTMYVGTRQLLTATGHYNNGTSQDLTAEVTWSSSDLAAAVISNAQGYRGVATALGATASVSLTAEYGGQLGSVSLVLIVDVNVPVAIAGAAFPDVILNDGVDLSRIDFVVKPYGEAGVVADDITVEFAVVQQGAVVSTGSSVTLGGRVSLNIASSYLGWMEIYARVPGYTSWAGVGVYSTDNLMSVMDVSDVSSLVYDELNSLYLAETSFGIVAKNLSNRVFQVVMVQLLSQEPVAANFSYQAEPYSLWFETDMNLLSGGFLSRGEQLNVAARLSRPLSIAQPWMRYVLYDPASKTYWHLKMPVGVQ